MQPNQHPQSLHHQGEINFRSVYSSESYQQLITIYDLRSTIYDQQLVFNEAAFARPGNFRPQNNDT